MRKELLGYIDTPAQGNKREPGVAWVADNGCFGKGYPGDIQYIAWLLANRDDAGTCLFATAPDVVGDAKRNIEAVEAVPARDQSARIPGRPRRSGRPRKPDSAVGLVRRPVHRRDPPNGNSANTPGTW